MPGIDCFQATRLMYIPHSVSTYLCTLFCIHIQASTYSIQSDPVMLTVLAQKYYPEETWICPGSLSSLIQNWIIIGLETGNVDSKSVAVVTIVTKTQI